MEIVHFETFKDLSPWSILQCFAPYLWRLPLKQPSTASLQGYYVKNGCYENFGGNRPTCNSWLRGKLLSIFHFDHSSFKIITTEDYEWFRCLESGPIFVNICAIPTSIIRKNKFPTIYFILFFRWHWVLLKTGLNE